VNGTPTTESVEPRAQKAPWWCPLALPRWLAIPTGDLAARLTLVGIIVALQNGIELPRGPALSALGPKLTGLLIFLMLGGSLALLLVALRERPPGWGWLRSRKVQALVLLATLAAVPTGVHQLGAMAAAGFQAPDYPNDGTTLDHYAAQELLTSHNPYVTVNIFAATAAYHQDPAHTTPLRCGAFAARPDTDYPSNSELRAVFAAAASGAISPCAFESHVSYPALAFLPLVPFVWAGFPSVVIFFTLCFAALVVLCLRSVAPPLRPWIALLLVADAPLLDATVGGVLDVFYILLLFVAWRWWWRPIVSSLFLGLALAAKQLAWFFVPFYCILVWREHGWRAALVRLGGAAAVFAIINAPFIAANPHAWLAGILAPEVDPMFPLGNGLVKLSLAGLVPLAPQALYTALEALGFAAAIAWYWRYGRSMPEAGLVLAVAPLFFAWRSLTTYFYFVALPAVVVLLARLMRAGRPAPPVSLDGASNVSYPGGLSTVIPRDT
jgi:hypothetical protein